MPDQHPRMVREDHTIEGMIHLYCRGKHGTRNVLCSTCRELLDYARGRLRKCPFQERKTTCTKCPRHCYKQQMRRKIQTVMRYSGPRMLYRHPILAVRHLLDGLRKEPSVARPERS